MASIFRKTAKGLAEIETRAHRLPPRLRSALIVVDGKRDEEALFKLVLQDPALTLQTLLEAGFIEVCATTAPAPTPRPVPVVAPASATLAPPAPSGFDQTRRDAVRALTDLIGPMGEALAIKMEKTRSLDELRPLLTVAMQVIANTRGRQAAANYGVRFGVDAGTPG
ncbi:MAG: hypothetical protein IV093_17505 [Rubrivivax sp.]|nr:hypothetical protein [Rubrivivax sp.]